MRIKYTHLNLEDFDEEFFKNLIKKIIGTTKKELGLVNEYELSLLFTNNKKIKELNYKYRKINKETNVLSFSQNIGLNNIVKKTIILGDIVLSLEKIKTESVIQSKKFKDHFSHIFLHGLMHLLGYQHEKKSEALLMEQIETRILSKLNINNPYE